MRNKLVSRKTVGLHRNLDEAVAGVNTIGFTAVGEGNHQLRSLNEITGWYINVLESGGGYENKQNL